MIGLSYALISFGYMLVAGYPLSCLLFSKDDRKIKLVISPLLGLCLTAILFYFLGYNLNLSSKSSTVIVLVGILFLNLAVALKKREFFHFKGLILYPFLAGLIYLFLLSIPFFKVGINYMSVWNEDFFGYVTVADYLKEHTVNEKISSDLFEEHPVYRRVALIVQDKFQKQFYRIGPEYYLCFFSVLLRFDPRYLFFPVLISFAILMPLALFLFLRIFSIPRILIAAVIFLLPFFSFHYFGFITQLFAQAAGIPVLLFLYFCFDRFFNRTDGYKYLFTVIISLFGLIILYVEALPFLIPFILYIVMLWVKKKRNILRDLKKILIVLVILLIILNVKFIQIFLYQFSQFDLIGAIGLNTNMQDEKVMLFPYFFLETGLPALWGLVTVPSGGWPLLAFSEYSPYIFIFLSIIFIIFAFLGLFFFPFEKKELWAFIASLLAITICVTFFKRMDYFLFKLILWFQFFFCSLLIIGIHYLIKRYSNKKSIKIIAVTMVFFLFFINLMNIKKIEKASLGGSTTWVEWKDASMQDHLQSLEGVKKILKPEDVLTVVVPGFHPGRWVSQILKNYKLNYLVNNNWHDHFSKYESGIIGSGWESKNLLLADPKEDIFENAIPADAILWKGSYFMVVGSDQIFNFIYPVSKRHGLIRQANPYIKEIIGWYPYEIYKGSSSYFEKRGFRWVQNNTTCVIKNMKREPMRIKTNLEIFRNIDLTDTQIDFEDKTIFLKKLSGQARVLSDVFVPKKDGLITIFFGSRGKNINNGRFLRIINKDIVTDERMVNARIRSLKIVPESVVQQEGFFFQGDRFSLSDLEKDNFYFYGIFSDGWATRHIGFMFDLKGKTNFSFKIEMPDFFYRNPMELVLKFGERIAESIQITGPGIHVIHVAIPSEFRKPIFLNIETDSSHQISEHDSRTASYLFLYGQFDTEE